MVLNLGGEGELGGAVNLNLLVSDGIPITLRRLDLVCKVPLLVQGDMAELPFRAGSFSKVVGNRVPWNPLDRRWGDRVVKEAHRVLRSGGAIQLYSETRGAAVWLALLRVNGFQRVLTRSPFAQGVKP